MKKRNIFTSRVQLFQKRQFDPRRHKTRRRALGLVLSLMILSSGWLIFSGNSSPAGAAQGLQSGQVEISEQAQLQIMALTREKESRTKTQRKISSQLLYAIKSSRNQAMAAGVEKLETAVKVDGRNRTTVEIICNDLKGALAKIKETNATVVEAVINTIRAEIPLSEIERIAEWPEVRSIMPKRELITFGGNSPHHDRNAVSGPSFNDPAKRGRLLRPELGPDFAVRADRVRRQLAGVLHSVADGRQTGGAQTQAAGIIAVTEGERAHRADRARKDYGTNGHGVKIGVISNGVVEWKQLRLFDELPNITVLGGEGSSNEGAAMLEIIYDLAPGAQLFFASVSSIPGFAQAIQDLRAAGCDIIVDDLRGLTESPFHDGQAPNVASTTNGGLVTQAVNEVTADGALYFSSAGNSGNLTDGTSTVYEGNFVDGGTLPLIPGGTVHAFGPGVTGNRRIAIGNEIVTLWWSDPLGGSANDYDLYLLDSTGSRVVAAATDIQDGTLDPFEAVASEIANARIVIFKKTGAQDRFLHLQSWFGKMTFSTDGEIAGHAIAADAYAVAASPAAAAFGPPPNPTGPFPNQFNSSNQSERFTSDGPRRIFYKADGEPYTPGDLSSTGGILRQKPDITAADGVHCATPGFESFFGTSAAAPHAAAIAALLKSAAPELTPIEVRQALVDSAIDIEAPGIDRDTGAGIIMPLAALQAVGARPRPLLVPDFSGTRIIAEANLNGQLDPGETVTVNLCLRNAGAPAITIANGFMAITGILEETGGIVDPPSNPRPFIIIGSGDSKCQQFTFKVGGEYGDILTPTLKLTGTRLDGLIDLGRASFDTSPFARPPLFLVGAEQVVLSQGFGGDNPELPPGWTTSASGAGEPWYNDGVAGGVFTLNVAATGESSLISPPIPITNPRAKARFNHNFNMSPVNGFINLDGGVLEIKIGDGEFQDILQAGGSFEVGGYTGPIFLDLKLPCFEPNPLNSRRAWVLDSRLWGVLYPPLFKPQFHTAVNLPASATGQTIQLRWRFGSDCGVALEGGGWRIDVVEIIDGYNNSAP